MPPFLSRKTQSYSLENWPLKKGHYRLTRLPGRYFFKAPSLGLHVYTRSGGWHTDLSLGWPPAAGAALAARPWEIGGRHPNVITAVKLLSIRAKLQKYVPRGLQTMKTEPCLSGRCPRRAVEVVLHYVWWDLLWARNRFHSCRQTSGCTCGWLCGNSYWVNLDIMPCYCSSSLHDAQWMCSKTVWGRTWLIIVPWSSWHECFDSQ